MENIEQQLKNLAPKLSPETREVLWSRIESRLTAQTRSVPQGSSRARHLRAAISGLVILGLLGGSVATAYAAESAIPGDILYSAKLTVEKVRVNLAQGKDRDSLQLAFANRRVEEVEKVLADVEPESESDLLIPIATDPTTLVLVQSDEPMLNKKDAPVMAMMAAEAPHVEGEDTSQTLPPPIPEGSLLTTSHPEGDEGSAEGEKNTQKSARRIVPENPSFRMQEGTQTVKEIKKRQWKNLEKKKHALQVVIKELHRTEGELKNLGEEEQAARVRGMIENLESLADTDQPIDDDFVERVKRGEARILRETLREHVEEKTLERQESRRKEDGEDLKAQIPEGMTGAVILQGEDHNEMEEIRERNSDRRKKSGQGM